MADVRDGVGPYLYVFLKGGLHWQSSEIGFDMPDKSGIDKNAERPGGNPHRWLTSVGLARAEVEIQSSAFRMKRTRTECV